MDEWPLELLVLRSPNLEYLKISNLHNTIEANRGQLLDFAAQAIAKSSCFRTLVIEETGSTAEEGDNFIQVLASEDISSLESVTIRLEQSWFEKGRSEFMAPLLVLLARQTALKELNLYDNILSDAQEEQINKVVTETAPECSVKFEKVFSF